MTRLTAFLARVALVAVAVAPGLAAADTPTPIPRLAEWEAHMTEFGARWGDYYIDHPSEASPGGAVYYDGQEVQERIAAYLESKGTTNLGAWYARSQAAEKIYEDNYLKPNGGQVPGYYSFPMGLYLDHRRTGDADSAASIRLLREKAAYHRDGTPIEWTAPLDLQREVAYALRAHIYWHRMLGNDPVSARYGDLAEQMFGDGTPSAGRTSHVDQLCVSKTYWSTGDQAKPFMAGLMLRTMILMYEEDPDFVLPRSGDTVAHLAPPAIKLCLDALWEDGWDGSLKVFKYELIGEARDYHADLNLLIAPAYSWYYWYSKAVLGEPESVYGVYRDRFNLIFDGGVAGACLSCGGKQFNQSYTWSFHGVAYYQAAQAASGDPGVDAGAPPPVDAGTDDPDAGSSPRVDGGTAPPDACAAGEADAGAVCAGGGDATGGCGCRSAPRPGGAAPAATSGLLLLLLLVARARRPRRRCARLRPRATLTVGAGRRRHRPRG